MEKQPIREQQPKKKFSHAFEGIIGFGFIIAALITAGSSLFEAALLLGLGIIIIQNASR